MDNISKVFIGVDVSKDTLDIHINPIGKTYKIGNNQKEIKKFIRGLKEFAVDAIGCESTGGYEKLLKELLKDKLYDLWIIDPRRIKAHMVSRGYRNKTDKIDAKNIAEFVFINHQDYEVIHKTDEQEKLQALVNRKNDLIKIRATEKTRLKHPSHSFSHPNIIKFIKVLDLEIKTLERQIDKLIINSDELSMKVKRLVSIPGIGKFTAGLLASFIPELGKLSNRKISALIGLCPYENESGKYRGKKFIKGGRSIPRKALYMCALTTIKYKYGLKQFYDHLRSNNKPFKIAIVAVMRKLLTLANALLKKSEFYKPNTASIGV